MTVLASGLSHGEEERVIAKPRVERRGYLQFLFQFADCGLARVFSRIDMPSREQPCPGQQGPRASGRTCTSRRESAGHAQCARPVEEVADLRLGPPRGESDFEFTDVVDRAPRVDVGQDVDGPVAQGQALVELAVLQVCGADDGQPHADRAVVDARRHGRGLPVPGQSGLGLAKVPVDLGGVGRQPGVGVEVDPRPVRRRRRGRDPEESPRLPAPPMPPWRRRRGRGIGRGPRSVW